MPRFPRHHSSPFLCIHFDFFFLSLVTIWPTYCFFNLFASMIKLNTQPSSYSCNFYVLFLWCLACTTENNNFGVLYLTCSTILSHVQNGGIYNPIRSHTYSMPLSLFFFFKFGFRFRSIQHHTLPSFCIFKFKGYYYLWVYPCFNPSIGVMSCKVLATGKVQKQQE